MLYMYVDIVRVFASRTPRLSSLCKPYLTSRKYHLIEGRGEERRGEKRGEERKKEERREERSIFRNVKHWCAPCVYE